MEGVIVLVTGGSGLLGNNILRQLHSLGHECLALFRTRPADGVLDGIDAEPIYGTLDDRDVIDRAVERCDAVIHPAGQIHIGWHHLDDSMRVNRDGTRNLVDAAIRHARKLVHVGTVDTLSLAVEGRPGDESTPVPTPGARGGKVPCSYVVSKVAGVKVVRRGVENGLRASIVHPGFMLGPWDWKPSSGRMAVEIGRKWRPLCPSGGCSVCDARDVADATIAAIEHGGDDGREFILAGENWTYRKLWGEIARRMDRAEPLIAAGPLARWVTGLVADKAANWTGAESDLNSAAIRMSSDFHYYDSSRAVNELGYHRRPIAETLDEAVAWLRQHHLGDGRPTTRNHARP